MALLKYPLNVGETGSEFPHSIHFSARKRNLSSQNEKSTVSQGDVVLYLPADALKTSYSQTFGDTDLGSVGAGLGGISSGQAEGLVNSITSSIQGATNLSTDALGAAADIFTGASGILGKANISGAIAQGTVNEAFKNLSGPAGAARDAILKKGR